jgi:alpha-tubulin suppressor-like RCC1 family protein
MMRMVEPRSTPVGIGEGYAKGSSRRSRLPVFFGLLATMVFALLVAPASSSAQDANFQGNTYAWGSNTSGQLGNGTNTDRNMPVNVPNHLDIKTVAGGGNHSLALKTDGTVRAWGSNFLGELGNGTNTGSNIPVSVSDLGRVKTIAAGGSGEHSLALKEDGTVRTWGDNSSGQLGNGTTGIGSNTPVKVKNVSGIKAIAGGRLHSLAVLPVTG